MHVTGADDEVAGGSVVEVSGTGPVVIGGTAVVIVTGLGVEIDEMYSVAVVVTGTGGVDMIVISVVVAGAVSDV